MNVAILGTVNMLAWCPPLEKWDMRCVGIYMYSGLLNSVHATQAWHGSCGAIHSTHRSTDPKTLETRDVALEECGFNVV